MQRERSDHSFGQNVVSGLLYAEQMTAGFLRRIFHPPPKVRAVVPLLLKIPAGPLQERRDQALEGLVFDDWIPVLGQIVESVL